MSIYLALKSRKQICGKTNRIISIHSLFLFHSTNTVIGIIVANLVIYKMFRHHRCCFCRFQFFSSSKNLKGSSIFWMFKVQSCDSTYPGSPHKIWRIRAFQRKMMKMDAQMLIIISSRWGHHIVISIGCASFLSREKQPNQLSKFTSVACSIIRTAKHCADVVIDVPQNTSICI